MYTLPTATTPKNPAQKTLDRETCEKVLARLWVDRPNRAQAIKHDLDAKKLLRACRSHFPPGSFVPKGPSGKIFRYRYATLDDEEGCRNRAFLPQEYRVEKRKQREAEEEVRL